MKIRPLKDDEDLTWHDLYRRLSGTFPHLKPMLSAFTEWKEQRDYYFALYAKIDNAKNAKYTKEGEIKSRKAAMKEYKRKH